MKCVCVCVVSPFIVCTEHTRRILTFVCANISVTQRREQLRQSQSVLVLHQYASDISWVSGQQRWDSCGASADGVGHNRGPNRCQSVPSLLGLCVPRVKVEPPELHPPATAETQPSKPQLISRDAQKWFTNQFIICTRMIQWDVCVPASLWNLANQI